MMRKLFHVIVILLGASLVLSSCEKAGGDEGSEDTIVGTWVCVEQAAALEDGTSVTYSDKEDWLEKYTYIAFDYILRFDEEGTFSSKHSYEDVFLAPAEYEIRDHVLYVKGAPMCRVILDGKKLMLTLRAGDNLLETMNRKNEAGGLKKAGSAVASYRKKE